MGEEVDMKPTIEKELKNDILWYYEVSDDKKGNKSRRLVEKRFTLTDDIGEHAVIEKSNGTIIKLLKKPSKKYIEKNKKRAAAMRPKLEAKAKKESEEKLINERIRQMAIDSLKKEGKL